MPNFPYDGPMNFLSPLFQNLFREYASAHADPRNRWSHLIGIPLIVVSGLGLLGRIHFPGALRVDVVLWAVVSIIYLRNARWMAVPFVLLLLLLCVLSRFIGLETLWTLFIIGWVSQFVGHYAFEKASPSFLGNLAHLIVGPFWIYCHFVKRAPGYREIFSGEN
jgi:uncharacterized membrane protein YGL010W